jgi:hypothetical protein
MRDSASRLITGDAVDSLDCDHVTVNVESLSDKRIIHQAGDRRADSAHTVLVSQVAAR